MTNDKLRQETAKWEQELISAGIEPKPIYILFLVSGFRAGYDEAMRRPAKAKPEPVVVDEIKIAQDINKRLFYYFEQRGITTPWIPIDEIIEAVRPYLAQTHPKEYDEYVPTHAELKSPPHDTGMGVIFTDRVDALDAAMRLYLPELKGKRTNAGLILMEYEETIAHLTKEK